MFAFMIFCNFKEKRLVAFSKVVPGILKVVPLLLALLNEKQKGIM